MGVAEADGRWCIPALTVSVPDEVCGIYEHQQITSGIAAIDRFACRNASLNYFLSSLVRRLRGSDILTRTALSDYFHTSDIKEGIHYGKKLPGAVLMECCESSHH